MKILTIFSGPIAALLFGCASGGDAVTMVSPTSTARPHHEVVSFFGSQVEPSQSQEEFDFQNRSPLEFLQELKKCAKNHRDVFVFTVQNEHVGWVLESDLPGLIALLDSREHACRTHRAIDSVLIGLRSTVGAESAYLIDSFRKGVYPPGGFSDRKEIRRWWKEYQRQKNG